MNLTASLTTGVAELLAGEGLGNYDEDTVIADPDTGIFLGTTPASPDRAIGITPYPVLDDDTTNQITGMQLRMRAGHDLAAVTDLADAVKDVLHHRRHYVVRGVHVELSWRQSQAWIGQDEHGRMELTSNYYFRTDRPGPFLTE
ncbi:minor capsid protein [Streptomyces sp. NPDC002952]|uniref:minor capsid protein n=1 Tax=Streptomyces sp. NPDC002952 TaxID=3364673 RepID=UPI003695434A